jgi:hypothetical protein
VPAANGDTSPRLKLASTTTLLREARRGSREFDFNERY